jgi:hypothetical protein
MRLRTKHSIWLASFGLIVPALLLLGCNKVEPSSPGAAQLQQAFKTTTPNVREFAEQGVAAEARNDFSTAFVHYRALSQNPELTPEQRNLANDSMLEMTKKLRQASTNGDVDAAKVLQMYRATK